MIVGQDGRAAAAEQLRRRLTETWTAPTSITFAATTLTNFHGENLAEFDVVMVLADCAMSQSAASSLLEIVEEAGPAVIALLNDPLEAGNFFEFAGAMAVPSAMEPSHLCLLLNGVLHRQGEVKRLKDEASLVERFHGGLKGQIARMHEELQLAALVQRDFLPRELPDLHGVEFAAMWRPTNYVSGDIYDLIRLDEDRVGVFIADAVGHGVPAALMTMVIYRSLITKETVGGISRILPPGEALARLNLEMIRRQGGSTRFATAVYAVVDCRRRTVQMAGAGHPPPLRFSSDGTTEVLETAGGLLGVFADESYGQIEFDLAVDDRLLFYTDGFEQAFPETAQDQHHRRLPTMRYLQEFDQLRRLPTATEMVETMARRVDDQQGSLHQVDDLTMICMNAGALATDRVRGDDFGDTQRAQPLRGGTLRLIS